MTHLHTVVVFDFDGVLVAESEYFKDEAWGRVFFPHVGKYEQYLAEAKARFGVGMGGDRYDILEYVYRKLGVSSMSLPTLIETGGKAFDDYVQARIGAVGIVPGTREALAEFAKRGPLYVNSGTNTSALKKSISALAIDSFFAGVFGGPENKLCNLKAIERNEQTEPQQVVFIGDGEGDRSAAKSFGCRFFGLANRWNKWGETPQPFPFVGHIREVLEMV